MFQLCFTECSAVEAKYRQAQESKLKYEEENPTKMGTTRKHRSLAKLFDKVGCTSLNFRVSDALAYINIKSFLAIALSPIWTLSTSKLVL